ncbi:MAG: flavodoxin family protein [Desulfobacteraceae bacterium]|nr:flavodoxin family protein [Desulfobacteraceae bacterium]
MNPFISGMKDAGAEVELLYTKSLNVKPCLTCSACMMNPEGACVQDDDMKELMPKFKSADIWVFGTPVYSDAISSGLKIILERTLPILAPFLEIRDGHSRYRLRSDSGKGEIVLVSSCSLWEKENFKPLEQHICALSENFGKKYSGSLLRPHASILPGMIENKAPVDNIFEAAKNTGTELISKGEILETNLETISRPLLPLEAYTQTMNDYFNSTIKQIS